jgi:nucleoporin POM152
MYNVAQADGFGGMEVLGHPTFSSIQARTRLELRTSTSGRIFYEVRRIGDAAYPLKRNDDILPFSDHLLFEQQVLLRPSARFRSTTRLLHCVYDTLTPRNGMASTTGLVLLEGTPPFTVELTIKSLAASEVQKRVVEVTERIWRLDVPTYTFAAIGPHVIRIESVQDASRCKEAPPDPVAQTLWVDVAESAAIVPLDRRSDYCVGDVSKFQLEGIPPWTVGSAFEQLTFSLTSTYSRTLSFAAIESTANHTCKKPKPRRSHSFSNNLANLR